MPLGPTLENRNGTASFGGEGTGCRSLGGAARVQRVRLVASASADLGDQEPFALDVEGLGPVLHVVSELPVVSRHRLPSCPSGVEAVSSRSQRSTDRSAHLPHEPPLLPALQPSGAREQGDRQLVWTCLDEALGLVHRDAVHPGGDHLCGADLAGVGSERVAIEYDEVGHLPGRDRAGVIAVVHPRRPARVRRERGLEGQRLLGQEGLAPAAALLAVRPPVDGDMDRLERVGRGDRPVAAGDEPGTGPVQVAEGVLPARRAPRPGTAGSGRPSGRPGRPTATARSRPRRARRTGVRRRGAPAGGGRCDGGRRPGCSRAANASSASRTPRSPIPWTCTWKPSASSRATYVLSACGSTKEWPLFCGRVAVARRGTAR